MTGVPPRKIFDENGNPINLDNPFPINYGNSSSVDAFGRLRVSNPQTIFDSKQIFDNQPLFWDESLESGGGIASSHSVDTASTVITSTLNTAGTFTRQTFQRFNYQPGKSQLIFMTGILQRSGGGTGVERRIGLFDDNNGIFFEDDANTVGITRRTNVTGTPVDNTIVQSSWNLDVMDGTGNSKITIDWSKTQIFVIDFEWLGVGRVRVGVNIDGITYYVHEFLNANVLDKVYISTPNLPLRYQMITTSSSPASTLECICTTVNSAGGLDLLGTLRYVSTSGTHVDANVADTIYAMVGIRLKAANIGATINPLSISVLSETNDNFEWLLILNPTVAGTFTYSDQANSSVQTATGATANTVTDGTFLAGGWVAQNTTFNTTIDNAIRLGSQIDGTVDEMVLCGRPLSSNADIQGAISWRELS